MNFLTLLVAAVMIVALGACGESETDTGPDSGGSVDVETAFLTVVHRQAPLTQGMEDSQLISLAKAYCHGYDSGLTTGDFAMMSLESGLDVEIAGAVLGAGVAAYCPEHTSKVG